MLALSGHTESLNFLRLLSSIVRILGEKRSVGQDVRCLG